MNESVFNLGDYFVSGVKITLSLELKIDDKGYVKMIVPLPDNYPDTEMKKSYENEYYKHLFSSGLVFDPFDNELPYMIISMYGIQPERYFNDSPERYFVARLNGFYIIPKLQNFKLTSDENNFLKGLGKRALCVGLNHLAEYYGIDTDRIIIYLEASGGAVRTAEDRIRFEQYKQHTPEHLMQMVREKFPLDYLTIIDDLAGTYTSEYFAKFLVSLENNVNLIKYYESLGFIKMSPPRDGVYMSNLLKILIDKCNQ